jgi:hypothetical protein
MLAISAASVFSERRARWKLLSSVVALSSREVSV